MTDDWLLVETLGTEPAVVAVGRRLQDLIPLATYLKRTPGRDAIQSAIAESVQTGKGLDSITSKKARVIRTEPVVMSDGRVHGVQVWSGPPEHPPPERPTPGPLKWNITLGVATDTAESLSNMGGNAETSDPDERAFAECWPAGDLKPNESRVLAAAVRAEPGHTVCDTWDGTDWRGSPIRVSFVARNRLEQAPNGRNHLIARGMNWRAEPSGAPASSGRPPSATPGRPDLHRALLDPNTWTLLKWLDAPCPFYDWRRVSADHVGTHPDDEAKAASMRTEFATGATCAVLRMPAHDGGWTPVHVNVERVEIGADTYAGLVSLRRPTSAEIDDAGLGG